MAETLREKLNRIDLKCIDEDLKFYDLRSLFEATAPRLTPEDKEEIKKVIQNTDDAETIAAVLQAKAMDKNESLEEDTDSLQSRIFDFLDDLGGYADYNQRIEEVSDEFGMSPDEAEGYVWDWTLNSEAEWHDTVDQEEDESLQEKLVDAPQEIVDKLLKILEKYGFILDDSIGHENPIRSAIFRDVHIQVINPNSYIDDDEISFDRQMETYVSRNMIDEISRLDDEYNCPITWNFGPNNKGQVTGGLDIMKQYIPDETDESLQEGALTGYWCPKCHNKSLQQTLLVVNDKRQKGAPVYECDDCDARFFKGVRDGELHPLPDYVETVRYDMIESLNEAIDPENIESALKNVLAVYVVDNAKTSPVIYTEELDNIENTKTDNPINVNPTMVAALLSGLQKCDSIYVEPTPKNREFMREYNLKPDDYINIFNQIKSSDFVKALHSTYPKYEDDLLFVFQSSEIKLTDQVADLEVYIKVNISKSDQDSVIAISFHKLNQFESLDEASYGGAYDIEDDMFFTKEELIEFGYDLAEQFSAWADDKCELSDVYMTSPVDLVMEVAESDGAEHQAKVKIDMRKIRLPRDIEKYTDIILKQWKDSYNEYHSYDESLNEDYLKDIVKAVRDFTQNYATEQGQFNPDRFDPDYINDLMDEFRANGYSVGYSVKDPSKDDTDLENQVYWFEKEFNKEEVDKLRNRLLELNKAIEDGEDPESVAWEKANILDRLDEIGVDYYTESVDDDTPYTYEQMEGELKSATNEWTEDNFEGWVGYKDEFDSAMQILSHHYENVDNLGHTHRGYGFFATRPSLFEDTTDEDRLLEKVRNYVRSQYGVKNRQPDLYKRGLRYDTFAFRNAGFDRNGINEIANNLRGTFPKIEVYFTGGGYRESTYMVIKEKANESLYEKVINLGDNKSVYSKSGKYYINSNGQIKEISKNQYRTLLNGKTLDKDLEKYKELSKEQATVDKSIIDKGFQKNIYRKKAYNDRSRKLSRLAKSINSEGDFEVLNGEATTSFINNESLTKQQEKSPKRYVYEICDKLGWHPPMFIDAVAGGYRLRYKEDSKEEAQETIDMIQQAASELGIKIKKALVKPTNQLDPNDDWVDYDGPKKEDAFGRSAPDWNSDEYKAWKDSNYHWTYYSYVVIPRYESEEATESLSDEKEYRAFLGKNKNANKKFDYKKYGKYFDKDGKIIPELEDEFFSIIKTADLSEAYVDADKDILDIIRSDKEYNSNAHVKSHIPDFSAIPNGTVITLKSLNKYHPEVQATIEKISDNNWKYVYSYGDGSWDRDLDNYGVMREINEVDRGAYESLNEAYSIGYVKCNPYNADLIYSVSIEGPYENRDGEKYNLVNLYLICGKDYVDAESYDGIAWVDAKQWVDDIQFEQLVWYPESESLNDVFKENEYEPCNKPNAIWHYNEEKDKWYRDKNFYEDWNIEDQIDAPDTIGKLNPGDKFKNRNGVEITIIEPQKDGTIQYKIDDEVRAGSEKSIQRMLYKNNYIRESLNELYYGDPDFHRKANIISQIVARYPDISQREEDYLGDLPYDELVRALKNRGLSFEEPENESLKEDYQHNDDEWGEPYTFDEVERELKKVTNDFTDEDGTIRCYWEQEKNYGLQILKDHYKHVEASDGRTGPGEYMSWVLAYSRPKEELDESLNIKALTKPAITIKDYMYDLVDNLDEDEIEVFNNLGFIKDNKIIIPKNTILKYVGNEGRQLLYQVKDTDYILSFNNIDGIFEDDFNNYFQIIESLNESVTSNLQDKIIDCLDYFIEMEMEFPKDKFLADSWEDVKDGIQMGIDPEFEVAEGIVEYLKPIITFNKKYNKEVEEEGIFQDEIEMYQSLVRAMNNYLAKNGYEDRIEEDFSFEDNVDQMKDLIGQNSNLFNKMIDDVETPKKDNRIFKFLKRKEK